MSSDLLSSQTRSDATVEGALLTGDALERARAVLPVVAAGGEQIEHDRCLTDAVLEVMHDARLFRMSLPASVNGECLDLPTIARVVQTVAMADASAAWCLGQAMGCGMSAAFLDEAPAKKVFGEPRACLAWGAGIAGTARDDGANYVANGTWQFASGSYHATWLGAHCKVLDDAGKPHHKASGAIVDRTMLMPRANVQMHDDWQVMGLRGTRSEGYTLSDELVAHAYSLDRDDPDECRDDATLYKFPTTAVYASVFSGVALGIAHASIDDLLDLARRKRARGAAVALKDSPVFQTQVAMLKARHGAAGAFQRETLARVWDDVSAGADLSVENRVAIRLASTHAIRECTEIVEQVYRMAGSDAIFRGRPFERRFRDMHAVSQQVQGRETNFETVGQHLLGHEVSTTFI